MSEPAYEETVDPYTFALAYRDVGTDRGWAIHVFGPVQGKREEILRFDCFEETPHYHLGFSYRDAQFVRIEEQDPFAWVIQALTSDFESFVENAGADVDVSDGSRAAIQEALGRLEQRTRATS